MRGIYDNFDTSNVHVQVHTTESPPIDRMDLYFNLPKRMPVVERVETMEYYTRAAQFGIITPNEAREHMGRAYGIEDAKITRRVLCAYCGGPPQDEDFCKNCGGPQKEHR